MNTVNPEREAALAYLSAASEGRGSAMDFIEGTVDQEHLPLVLLEMAQLVEIALAASWLTVAEFATAEIADLRQQ